MTKEEKVKLENEIAGFILSQPIEKWGESFRMNIVNMEISFSNFSGGNSPYLIVDGLQLCCDREHHDKIGSLYNVLYQLPILRERQKKENELRLIHETLIGTKTT